MIGPTVAPELIHDLETAAQSVSKRKGEILFRRGENAAGVFLILSGNVNLELEGVNGVAAVRTHGPGSIVGLPANLSGSQYSLTAEVIEDATLGFIPRARLLQILQESPGLCLQVMQILSEEIAHSREITEALLTGKRRGRTM